MSDGLWQSGARHDRPIVLALIQPQNWTTKAPDVNGWAVLLRKLTVEYSQINARK